MEAVMDNRAFGFGKDALTTGEVAGICNVAARTVSKWIDSGRLPGYRIPGSRDHRVHVRDLEAFVAAHGIPVTRATRGAAPLRDDRRTHVLVVDADRTAAETVRGILEGLGTFRVSVAADAIGAACAFGALSPDVVVFDRSAGDATAFVRAVRAHGRRGDATFVASGPAGQLPAAFPGETLAKPYAVRTLVEAMAPVARRPEALAVA
jgi:excisionase family DNA binding protein